MNNATIVPSAFYGMIVGFLCVARAGRLGILAKFWFISPIIWTKAERPLYLSISSILIVIRRQRSSISI